MDWIWLPVFILVVSVLGYHRASLKVWTVGLITYLILLTFLSSLSWISLLIIWLVIALPFILLNIPFFRYKIISQPALKIYLQMMPSMSKTEREALAAGTVSWEGELFRGKPNWKKFNDIPRPTFSEEEQAFIEGPLATLCSMIDDWDITHKRGDLPREIWDYLKKEGFFSLIIPKKYGGKEFSAYAHSEILAMIYGRSVTAGSTVAVPNSLGPAELLLHYGTEEQKNYYLPRLASGEEVPCFALTGPEAGSDAGSIPDKGVVCWGDYQGKKIIGIRLDFDKRYITLAPIATVIGLAFKLDDPDHILGKHTHIGITCALIPRDTPGISIGRRHYPINAVFQNGPIHGNNIFIPLDWVIGGQKMAGQGWKMLMECLAAGRGISLPSSSIGGAKSFTYATSAYARIRRQFNTPIGRFEGIEEVIARMIGNTYIMDATRSLTANIIDQGEKPAIASAITKYHVTELGRVVANDGMDVHAGKGICLGPSNYLARFYEAIPIAITVEGANILTRCLIIFGQGAMRCHPYVFAELEAAREKDEKKQLILFDKALIGHIGYTVCNFIRSFILGLTNAIIVRAPNYRTKRYYQHITRFSTAFALLADMSLLTFGGGLKRKESISARLGDIFSYLYMLSAVLKLYENQDSPPEDFPIVEWCCYNLLYNTQVKFQEILSNFPNRLTAFLLNFILFPLGKHWTQPKDYLNHKMVQLLLAPSDTRERFAQGVYLKGGPNNVLALLDDALMKTIQSEALEKAVKSAHKEGTIEGENLIEQAKFACQKNIITEQELELLLDADQARKKVIDVDDFDFNILTS